MKRTGLFLVLAVLLAVGTVNAHDKGDLMVSPEFQPGLVFGFSSFGFDFSLSNRLHYYFTDFFGVNIGLGFSGLILFFPLDQAFNRLYFTVPVGFRFSFSLFTFGGGITANIPINEPIDDDLELDPDIWGIFNMGWYTEVGFDLSGRKNRRSGIGVLYRFYGSFTNFSRPSKSNYNYEPSPYIALSVVFQINIQVASLPIGKRRKEPDATNG